MSHNKIKKTRKTSPEKSPIQLKAEKTKDSATESLPNQNTTSALDEYERIRADISDSTRQQFERWESEEFVPEDFETPVDASSLEARVGYSSLLRQLQRNYVRTVAFYRSKAGGALSLEESRKRAFRGALDREEAMKELNMKLSLPVESLNFADLGELYAAAPRVAERFWEEVKIEGRKEFESGHLAANITFPTGYMKQVWNIARYLGVRESFIDEWVPSGGIEAAMIDMLAQSYFQWQYWLEQTVRRSETPEKEEHPAYQEWKRYRQTDPYAEKEFDRRWIRPYVSDVQAVEHAVQMADRFHRIFMRTLRQLRDLRRYSPVTINNASQVNIAADGGQQVNVADSPE